MTLTLSAKIRQKGLGKKAKALKKKGILPAILYGPKIKTPLVLELDDKNLEKIYKEAGESSLISLKIQPEGPERKSSASNGTGQEYMVLIHEIQRHPLTGQIIHVDFYQVPLEEAIVVRIPLIFEGKAPAVKDLGGTLVKNISEVEVKALPQKLPKEIKVDVKNLKTFEENIKISDLRLPEGVKILKEPEEIVVHVLPPEKVEQELEKPVEEKV